MSQLPHNLSMPAILLSLLLVANLAADDKARLAESLETWNNVKAECQGNYSYTVVWSSVAGFGWKTEIVMRSNVVVERHYQGFGGEVPKKWVEKGTQLGDHREGAPPLTLDQLYADAKLVLARPVADHERRYLTFDRKGLLLSCFTVDTNIADDAPTRGVSIASINLKAKPKATPNAEAPKPKVYKSPGGKPFPTHWGQPPRIQTRDLRRLPGGYGAGSSTLYNWIVDKMKKDAQR